MMAQSARAALLWAFDLVILDLLMPGMGGLNFLAERQNEKTLRAIPVAVLTESHLNEGGTFTV
jgi:CheY-like chemotaxis protein